MADTLIQGEVVKYMQNMGVALEWLYNTQGYNCIKILQGYIYIIYLSLNKYCRTSNLRNTFGYM